MTSEQLDAFILAVEPFLPIVVPLIVVTVVCSAPLPGRGPGLQGRDPWRTFRFGARRQVFERARGRCEASLILAWGRCRKAAEEIDHVYPWSKGGATVVSNGQALCHRHNRAKGSRTPAWWYLLSLERRRRSYFPDGTSVRVSAGMNDADRAARAVWLQRQGRR